MRILSYIRARGDTAMPPVRLVQLVPWPDTEPHRGEAIIYLQSQVAGRTLEDQAAADSLGSAAAEMVLRYCGTNAPTSVATEAIVRYAGYLAQADFGGIVKETGGLPGNDIEYVTNHASAFRNSGAAGLLSPWKIRRAGAIG